MEGERRKRKLESAHEEENEEQKMEKFFALIKSTKDARDHFFNNKDKKAEEDQKGEGIWTPAFQPEDFTDYGEFGKSNVSTTTQAGPSEEEEEKDKEKGKEVMIDKEYLQEASPAVVAPPAQENHDPEEKEKEKEKASDPLDLNLSL